MSTFTQAAMPLRLFAAILALILIAAFVVAVTLTAGPTMAQDGTDPSQLPRIGDNAEEYDDPLPCSEEKPLSPAAGIIDRDFYAVFDAFWDYEVGHLSNNFCPPKVTVTTEDDGLGHKTITHTRTDANIDIRQTAFAIPDSYKVTVIDTGASNGTSSNVTGPTIDLADYPFLKNSGAVSAVETENGANVFAGNSLWWVRLDEPGADADETSPLQMGFSTDLLEEADWHNPDGAPVQFRFAAVHVLQDGTPQEAHVVGAHFFAFDQRETDTPLANAQWSNVDTDGAGEIDMQTGQYRQMQFAFTKPGMYLVQVNAQAHVRAEDDPEPEGGRPENWSPISPDESITSPVQWYTFHVGPRADLHTQVSAGEVTSTGGASSVVPFTVTVANHGPEAAENVAVEVNLPAGLSAPGSLPHGATSSGCGVIAWKVNGTGSIGANTSPSLTFNANVDIGAVGRLTATVETRSTTFDPNLDNNSASAHVTLSNTTVRPPFFPGVTRSIVEHAVAGTHAGAPVAAVSPEGRALHYSLTGPCSNKFQVHRNGQIVLAAGHTLDYAQQWEYRLTLHVSDMVNASAGDDSAIDDSTPVLVRVEDTEPGLVHPTVTFTLSNPNAGTQPNLDLNHPVVGYTVNVNAQVENLPAGATPTYTWEDPPGISALPTHTSYYSAYAGRAGPETYRVHVKWDGGGITASYTVEWYNP